MPTNPKELARLSALREMEIMDSEQEAAYDDITRLAAFICDAPIAYISFLDDTRQWYKSQINLPISETTLDDALCSYTIYQTELVHVPDLSVDPNFSHNPFVKAEGGIRFYAGYPLITSEGGAVGTICVLDYKVRQLSDEQKFALEALGRQVLTQLELRKLLKYQKAAHQQTKGVLDSITSPFISLDREKRIIYTSSNTRELLGGSGEELLHKQITDLMPGLADTQLHRAVDSVLRDKTRLHFEEFYPTHNEWYEVDVTPNSEGGVSLYLQNITLRKQAEEKIFYQASYDQLTGLPNRLLLSEKLKQVCKQAKRDKTMCGILFLDLNQFKSVNDSLGHPAGDALLRSVAKRLQKAVRQEDIVSRFGGDEFIIVLGHLKNAEAAKKVAQTIIDSFSEPFRVTGHQLEIQTSIGIALYPQDGIIQEDLIKHADIALYTAKEQAEPHYAFYSK